MTRIAHAADLHISGDGGVDPDTGGDRRRERLRRAWLWVCQDAVQRGTTHFVIAGDVFHTPHPEPADYVAFMQGVGILLHTGIYVVVVPGNHDWELATGLQHALSPMHLVGELSSDRFVLISEPHAVDVGGQVFVGFPHPHRRAFDARPDIARAAISDRVGAVGQAMQDLIEQHGERYPGSILVAHVTTVGAKVAAERVMSLGWDVTVDASCLSHYGYAALGHIHRYQRVAPNAAYAGPIDRLSFADEDIAPGYVIVDTDTLGMIGGWDVTSPAFAHIPYPSAARYITVTSVAGEAISPDIVAGAYVRVIGHRTERTGRALDALRRAGALSVVDATENPHNESSAIPSLNTGISPLDALDLYMAVRPPTDPVTPDDARARLSELDVS